MMFYKGGPKNYSKNDWKFIGALIGLTVIGSVIANILDPSSDRTAEHPTSTASKEYIDAARRAGYTGRDGEQVAEAAERLCIATGEC